MLKKDFRIPLLVLFALMIQVEHRYREKNFSILVTHHVYMPFNALENHERSS
ncbi:unnamed protein product [Albugo candida]|uniref:Uncharacterized protein n=1 Tax=Albugo candida TaxID=65357 RepID=A0A024GNT6_9STRA|nr:unnamed protein product [Albugo candida]|eukprot:CCI48420.1 unnamed protein product [Albugo candida]